MSRSAFYSIAFHSAVIAVAWVGLPRLLSPPPPVPAAVEVAIEAAPLEPTLPAPEIPAQASEAPQPAPPPERKAALAPALPPAVPPARQVQERDDERPQRLAAAAPPPPPPAQTPAPPPPRPEQPQAKAPDSTPSPPVPDAKPAPPAAPPPAAPPAAAAPPPKPADETPLPPPKVPDRFDNMLRDIAEKEPAPAPEPPERKEEPDDVVKRIAQADPPAPERPARQSRASQMAAILQKIRSQIQANWTRPPALQITDDLVVALEFRLRPDGTIFDPRVDEEAQARSRSDPKFQPFVDSALRAVQRTDRIEGLDPEDYEIWQYVRLKFRPQS